MDMHYRQSRLFRASGMVIIALLGIVFSLKSMSPSALAASATITPAATLNDNRGILLQAHGGGMIKVGSTYYLFGEDKTGESSGKATFQNVPCYSSTDLAHWTFVNNVLTQQASGDLGPNRIIERPKVIYNSTTQQYVMYMHVDSITYGDARVGVATSSTVCGNYNYVGSFQPLGFQSRDMGLFQDDNGTAYLLSEDRVNGLRIDKLSSDYLSVTSAVAVLTDYEAPAMFKLNGRYYLFGSHLTSWNTNDNQYTTATSLAGPWSSWSNFAPTGTNTFNSQTTFVLPISGSQGTTFMYMGDRWTPSSLGTSPYIWLPLQVNGANVSMTWHNSWSIDTSTGIWQDSGSTNYEIVSHNSGKVIDVSGSSTADGAQLVQWPWHSGTNQEWSLRSISGGYYEIVNRNSGKVLEALSGTQVTQGTWSSGTNQQWSLVALNGGYNKLVNRNSGQVLDVAGYSTADGAVIDQWTDNGGANQQWTLLAV